MAKKKCGNCGKVNSWTRDRIGRRIAGSCRPKGGVICWMGPGDEACDKWEPIPTDSTEEQAKADLDKAEAALDKALKAIIDYTAAWAAYGRAQAAFPEQVEGDKT